jgi:hypothetical protein
MNQNSRRCHSRYSIYLYYQNLQILEVVNEKDDDKSFLPHHFPDIQKTIAYVTCEAIESTSKRQLKKQLGERQEGKKHFSEQGIQQTSPLSTLTNASIRENPSNCRVFAISSICFLHLCKAFSLQRK